MSYTDFKTDSDLFTQITENLTEDAKLVELRQAFKTKKNVTFSKENGVGEKLEEAFAQAENSATKLLVAKCLTTLAKGAYILKNSEQLALAYVENNEAVLQTLLLTNVSRVTEESPALDAIAEKIVKEKACFFPKKQKQYIKTDFDILLRLLGPMAYWGNKKVLVWLKATNKNFADVSQVFKTQDIKGAMLPEMDSQQLEMLLQELGQKAHNKAGKVDTAIQVCIEHLKSVRNGHKLVVQSLSTDLLLNPHRGLMSVSDPFHNNFYSLSGVGLQQKPTISNDQKAQGYENVSLPELGEFIYGYFATFSSALPAVMGAANDYFGKQDCETKWDAKQASLQVQITLATGYCGILFYFFQHASKGGNLGVRVCRGEGEGLYVHQVANELKEAWEEKDLIVQDKRPVLENIISEPGVLPDPSPNTVPETKQMSISMEEKLSNELQSHVPGDIELTDQMCTDNITGFNDAVGQMENELGQEVRNDRYLKKVCRENAIMLSQSLRVESNIKVIANCGEELAKSLLQVWKKYDEDYTITLKATDVLKQLKESEVIAEDCLNSIKELAQDVRSRWAQDSADPAAFPSERILKNLEALLA